LKQREKDAALEEQFPSFFFGPIKRLNVRAGLDPVANFSLFQ
jgi:hypothetical protein